MDATELAYAGIARQAEVIADGEVSSRELVELYLERIARLDARLNAFRVVWGERAREEADDADRQLRDLRPEAAARPHLPRAALRALARDIRQRVPDPHGARHGRVPRGDGGWGPRGRRLPPRSGST